ncbi:Anthranilate synthase component 1 [bacterium HR19]|nr:Anthranilate synthase component 1 [bacterium HR19]
MIKYQKVLLDTETPISLFMKLKQSGFNPIYLLESAEEQEKWGRYSFLGFGEPKMKIIYSIKESQKNTKKSSLIDLIGEKMHEIKSKYFAFLDDFKKSEGINRLPFGLVGYISYDVFSEFEKLDTFSGKEDAGFPDSILVFTPNFLIFDNVKKDVILVSEDVSISDILKVSRQSVNPEVPKIKVNRVSDKTEKKEFEDIVSKAIKRIYDGDCIQVVLSRAKEFELSDANALSFYRILRLKNPSPYMYILDFGDIKIVGTSPEVLVRVEGRKAEVRPIAGTRRRGETEEEDKKLELELLSDEKEMAEHVMLVDLARNDLGRVCSPGTVKVKKFAIIEKYSRVMHIVSEVEGEVREGVSEFEVFRGAFPAGTVVGAPKIEAAKIIAELEKEKRGPYAGAVGYFSADGNIDTAILIRTAFFNKNKMRIQAGAGIVFYSQPEREFFETESKMKALEDALNFISS